MSRNTGKGEHYHEREQDPLQNLSVRGRNADGLVQSPGRYAEQAGPPSQPRHRPAHDRPGAGGRILHRAGTAGAGQRHRLFPDPRRDTGFLQNVPALSPGPGLLPGAEAGHAGENLLQI